MDAQRITTVDEKDWIFKPWVAGASAGAALTQLTSPYLSAGNVDLSMLLSHDVEAMIKIQGLVAEIPEPSVAERLLPIPTGWSDWMIDNIPDNTLHDLAKDLLESAISACNTGDHEGLIFTIHDWQATIEELSRPPEEIEAILGARDEVRMGDGLSWDEFWQGLEDD